MALVGWYVVIGGVLCLGWCLFCWWRPNPSRLARSLDPLIAVLLVIAWPAVVPWLIRGRFWRR